MMGVREHICKTLQAGWGVKDKLAIVPGRPR